MSTVDQRAALKAKFLELKAKKDAELSAKLAAAASEAKGNGACGDAAAPAVPPTVAGAVEDATAPINGSNQPSRPQTPAPATVAAPVVFDDGKVAPDFSKRQRGRGIPPSTLRDPPVMPRVNAARLLLGLVKPALRGVVPVPSPKVVAAAPPRRARDDSLGRASSDSMSDTGGGAAAAAAAATSAVDAEESNRRRKAENVEEPPKVAHRSEAGPQVAADAPSAAATNRDGPLRDLIPETDAGMREAVLPGQRHTRSATEFSRSRRISEGVYGVVYEGIDIATRQGYALKWIKDRWFIESKVGFPDYLLREIDLMARLRHPNIVSHVCMATCAIAPSKQQPVEESQQQGAAPAQPVATSNLVKVVAPSKNASSAPSRVAASDALTTKLFLVSEYAGATLRNEIYRGSDGLGVSSVKWLLAQLLRGLRFMHSHHVLHRDLKPSNVLVDDHVVVKLCDMGLARTVRPSEMNLTTTVITLMYRPPELHYGLRSYDSSVDMWSIGCIAAEMVLRQPLFPCTEDSEHLQKVCEVLGAPTNEAIFPSMLNYSVASEALSRVRVPPEAANAATCYSVPIGATSTTFISCTRLRKKLLTARPDLDSPDGLALIDLIDRLLQWSPRARLSAAEALEHAFFTKGVDASAAEVLQRREAYAAEKARLRMEASATKAASNAARAASVGAPAPTLATAGEGSGESPQKNSDDDDDTAAAEGMVPKDVGVHHVAHDDDADR